MQRTALVVGVSGIGGSNTARGLISQGWTVYGLARRRVDPDVLGFGGLPQPRGDEDVGRRHLGKCRGQAGRFQQVRGLVNGDVFRWSLAKSRKLGSSAWQATEESFFDLFAQLRGARLIP